MLGEMLMIALLPHQTLPGTPTPTPDPIPDLVLAMLAELTSVATLQNPRERLECASCPTHGHVSGRPCVISLCKVGCHTAAPKLPGKHRAGRLSYPPQFCQP